MPRLLAAFLPFITAPVLLAAEGPRVFPAGELPRDARLAPLKDLDGYFPFTPPASPEAWAQRAERMRMQMRVALGIWPEPTRTPLNAVIHGKVERDDYTVEKVYFEAMPGFFVTGNLYRPKAGGEGRGAKVEGAEGKVEGRGSKVEGREGEVESRRSKVEGRRQGEALEGGESQSRRQREAREGGGSQSRGGGVVRRPGVLAPHGHWPEGRFTENDDKATQKALATGAELFESGARSPLQARCVQLARAGCVAFHYDMIGYCDSVQVPQEVAHKFAKQRPWMNAGEGWGFFSPRAEENVQSIMGLQTWSSVRALDFLETLPDVDPQRLAITGESGGGTQTMILAALDDRVRTAFPAVMVSTAMQGGCTCENASLLRVGTGNVEFAALFAPKPMAMSCADDWTKEMPAKGFPELKQLWTMLGAPGNVALSARLEFPHNFNSPNRAAMIAWFNKHLALGLTEAQMAERDFQRLSREEMTVWDTAHPAPAERGEEFEKKLLRWWRDDAQGQMTAGPSSLLSLLKIAASGVEAVVGWEVSRGSLEHRQELELRGGGGTFHAIVGSRRSEVRGTESPMIEVSAPRRNGWTVLWLDERGKAGLFTEGSDELRPEVTALLEAGADVVGVDLFEQGEFLPPGEMPPAQTRRVKNPREAAAYTFGYNRALLAQRAGDVIDAINDRKGGKERQRCAVVAFGSVAPVAVAASAVAGPDLGAMIVETGGFRFGEVGDLWSPSFLPGGAKYGDVPGMLALGAPRPLLLLGEPAAPALLREAYQQAGAERALRAAGLVNREIAVEWLKSVMR